MEENEDEVDVYIDTNELEKLDAAVMMLVNYYLSIEEKLVVATK